MLVGSDAAGSVQVDGVPTDEEVENALLCPKYQHSWGHVWGEEGCWHLPRAGLGFLQLPGLGKPFMGPALASGLGRKVWGGGTAHHVWVFGGPEALHGVLQRHGGRGVGTGPLRSPALNSAPGELTGSRAPGLNHGTEINSGESFSRLIEPSERRKYQPGLGAAASGRSSASPGTDPAPGDARPRGLGAGQRPPQIWGATG